jgi:hypothetical protein
MTGIDVSMLQVDVCIKYDHSFKIDTTCSLFSRFVFQDVNYSGRVCS